MKRKITCFKYTKETEEAFAKKLLEIDWRKEYQDVPDCVDAQVGVMDTILDRIVRESFKQITYTVSEDDAPWMTSHLKKRIKQRKRHFIKHCPVPGWQKKRTEVKKMISEAKKNYLKNAEEQLTQEGAKRLPYNAIRNLKTLKKPRTWQVQDLCPGATDKEISEKLAEYFNGISTEFEPLEEKDCLWYNKTPEYLMPHEVSTRLHSFKKPKSLVNGDINPTLVTDNADLLAIPLNKIYNTVKASGRWPAKWKNETVTVIPKAKKATEFD